MHAECFEELKKAMSTGPKFEKGDRVKYKGKPEYFCVEHAYTDGAGKNPCYDLLQQGKQKATVRNGRSVVHINRPIEVPESVLEGPFVDFKFPVGK